MVDPSTNELTIECEALGVPKPKIIWLWSGQLVEDGKDEFRIYDVTPINAQDRAVSKLIAQKSTRSGTATCQVFKMHNYTDNDCRPLTMSVPMNKKLK